MDAGEEGGSGLPEGDPALRAGRSCTARRSRYRAQEISALRAGEGGERAARGNYTLLVFQAVVLQTRLHERWGPFFVVRPTGWRRRVVGVLKLLGLGNDGAVMPLPVLLDSGGWSRSVGA